MQRLRMTSWRCQKTAEPSRNDAPERLKGSDTNPQRLTPIRHLSGEEIIYAERQTMLKSGLHHVIQNSLSVKLRNHLPYG